VNRRYPRPFLAALALQRGLDAFLEPPSGTGKFLDVAVIDRSGDRAREAYVECTANQAIPDAVKNVSDGGLRLWPFVELGDRGLQARVELAPDLTARERAEAEQLVADLYAETEAAGAPRDVDIAGLEQVRDKDLANVLRAACVGRRPHS
jgi:hypothetical protein